MLKKIISVVLAICIVSICELSDIVFAQETKCPNCATVNPADVKFCRKCGAQLRVSRVITDEAVREKIRNAGADLRTYSTFYYAGLGLYTGSVLIMILSPSEETVAIGVIGMLVGSALQLLAPMYIGNAGKKLQEVKNYSLQLVSTNNQKNSVIYAYKF